MVRWCLIFASLLLSLVACTPSQTIVVVTATPPEATPTQEVAANPHTECLKKQPFCEVSANPYMEGPMRTEYAPVAGGTDRIWKIPAGWRVFYRYKGQCTDGAGSELQTPDMPSTSRTFRINTAWIAGCIDLETTYDTYDDVRYLVQLKYEWVCNSPIASSSQVAISSTIFRSDGTKLELENKFLDGGSANMETADGEAFWLVQPGKRTESVVRFRVFIPAGVCGGESFMRITRAGVFAVRNDYGQAWEIYR